MKPLYLLVWAFAGLGTAWAVPPIAGGEEPTAVKSTRQLDSWQGKPLPLWKFGRRFWTNTPRPIWLGGLRGRVTVVEVLRINCVHCQNAAPSRRALFLKFRGPDFRMVGIQSPGLVNDARNTENNWKIVRQTIRNWKLPYPVAFDQGGRYFQGTLHGDTYPTVFVLDRRGVVRFVQTGWTQDKAREMEEAVASALREK